MTYPAPTRLKALAHPGGAVAALAVVGLVLSACGSSSPTSATTTTAAPAGNSGGGSTSTSAATGTDTVKTASSSSFGTILVNSSGMALYTLAPGTSCTGACAQAWPTVTVPAGATPKAGSGVTGTLGTTMLNGADAVTYNGKVLYTFLSDSSPGQVTGNGVAGFSVAKVSAASGASGGSATTTTTTARSSGY